MNLKVNNGGGLETRRRKIKLVPEGGLDRQASDILPVDDLRCPQVNQVTVPGIPDS